LQLLYDPRLFTAHHDEVDLAQFQPALLGCKRRGSRPAAGMAPDVTCETVPMPELAKLPLRRRDDDPSAPVWSLRYVEAPLSALERFDYLGVEIPADSSSVGFLQAAVVEPPTQLAWAPGYLRLLWPTTIRIPVGGGAVGMRTRLRLVTPENPLVVFRATVAAQDGPRPPRFPPAVRQSDGRRFESKFWYAERAADIAIHGRGAYFSTDGHGGPDAVGPAPVALWDGIHIDVWTDAAAGLDVTLQINWYSTLNRMVKRHDMALLALSFVWACLVMAHQLWAWWHACHPAASADAADCEAARPVFPSCLGSIERLVRNGTLAAMLAAGLLVPVVQEVVAQAAHGAWSPETRAAWSNLFMGVRGSGWPLCLAPALLVVVSLGFVTLQAAVLAAICHLTAWLAACAGCRPVGARLDAVDAECPKPSPKNLPARALLATLAFVVLVSTAVPYQFAFLVVYIAQLITATRSLLAARVAGASQQQQQRQQSQTAAAFQSLANYQLGLLLFWTSSLPYCAPELLVWVRNISVLWFEDAPADHGVANVAGYFTLRLLASYQVAPRLPPTSAARRLRALVYVAFGLVVGYAWLFGTRQPYVLYTAANAISALLAAVHFIDSPLRLLRTADKRLPPPSPPAASPQPDGPAVAQPTVQQPGGKPTDPLDRKLRAYQRDPVRPLTAALCVIGDEVLSGKTPDANSQVFARRCFELGVDVQRIEVVPDNMADIAETLQRLSGRHAIVFTSGGIGPTHDDVTYSAVASAFGDKLTYHQPTLARMHTLMRDRSVATMPNPSGTPAEVACARMALLPEGAAVTYPAEDLWVPVVCAGGNVHMFPGIPALFAKLVDTYLPGLVTGLASEPSRAFVRTLVGTDMRESAIAPVLAELQRRYGEFGVKLGSYPEWPLPRCGTPDAPDQPPKPRVVLSAVGKDELMVRTCELDLCRRFEGR
ncbi:3-hydroxyanthranilic acid dioxygenase, partial [Coemansia nantahalensis]